MLTFLITLAIVAVALALLCVKLLVKRNGTFSSMHVDDSEAMRQRGIRCVIEQDREARNKQNSNQ